MKALFQEAFLVLALAAAVLSVSDGAADPASKTQLSDALYQYEDYTDESVEVHFNEDKPCPRDCLCTTGSGSKIARCSRLEVGTQKFGEDITGLVVEDVDGEHPITLGDMIFMKLGLHEITNIKIANSSIVSISPTAFNGLHQLYSVNLSANGIQSLDPNTFALNKKLNLLSLSKNPLTLSKLGSQSNEYFLNTPSVQELDISKCGLKNIPKKTFSKMSSLLYINLSGNKIQELDPLIFESLIDLEEIDLNDNFIRSVPTNLFKNNNEMTTLKIGNNPLDSVIGLTINELLTLDIGNAKIRTIGPSMFNGMPYVSNLNLSGNGIQKIHNQAFHKLVELNLLDLSNNNMNYISDQLIKENAELDVFKIANNPMLTSLPKEGFTCAAEKFNIYLFDASGCSLKYISNDTFKSMPALTQLNLSNNRIGTIGYALHHTTKLVDVDLSYNLITTLDKFTFYHNPYLGKLNLAGNPIVSLSSDLFVNTPVLTWLDVSFCRLSNLWENKNAYPDGILNNLRFVNISNNQIKSLHYKELEKISKLYTLDISQNPLECTEEFESLMTWLGTHKVSPAARDILASNLEMSEKNIDHRYKWSFLAKQTCGPKESASENDPIADSEEDVEYYYYDDDKLLNDTSSTTEPDSKTNGKIANKLANEHIADEFKLIQKAIIQGEKNNEGGKDKAFLDELNRVIKSHEESESDNIDSFELKLPELNYTVIESQNEVSKEKIEDKTNDIAEDMEISEDAYIVGIQSSSMYRDEFLPVVLTAFIVFALIVMIVGFARAYHRNHSSPKCTIITISSAGQGKVKKDCGLVYQQLSEDLTGPKTPIIKRHEYTMAPTSPPYSKNVFPESV